MQCRTIPYRPEIVQEGETRKRLELIYREADARRTVRMFSRRDVPRQAIELAILTAGTAPSGAHLQPWHFVAISGFGLR